MMMNQRQYRTVYLGGPFDGKEMLTSYYKSTLNPVVFFPLDDGRHAIYERSFCGNKGETFYTFCHIEDPGEMEAARLAYLVQNAGRTSFSDKSPTAQNRPQTADSTRDDDGQTTVVTGEDDE